MQFKNGNLIDIVWSPIRENEFIAFDSDLYLYRIQNIKSSSIKNENSKKLCDETCAEVIVNYGENSNPRVVGWQKNTKNTCLLAVYFQNHKIQLIDFKSDQLINGDPPNNRIEIIKEFSFKQHRQCSSLTWNSYQEHILAAGFSERLRNEHSILVWDVRGSSYSNNAFKVDSTTESIIYANESSPPVDSAFISNKSYFNSLPRKTDIIKPIYETSASEACYSLSWNPHYESTLLAGLMGKLKIFDIKDKSKGGLSVNTKFIHSFSMDSAPNASHFYAASFNENTIAIWDIRMFDKPMHQINESESILKIQWCPSKCGNLATLYKNSSSINIYSIKSINNSLNSSVIEDEFAPTQLIVDKTNLKCPMRINTVINSTPAIALTSTPVNNKQAVSTNNSMRPLPINTTTSITTNPSISSTEQSEHQQQTNKSIQLITNFCWYNFDTNKILIACNSKTLTTLSLFDTFILSWSPNDDLFWSSNSSKINTIDNLNKNSYDFIQDFKERTKADYGLKYEIITITNGTATSVSSSTMPFLNSQIVTTPIINSSPSIPLALSLNAYNGLPTLIRSDFKINMNICEFKSTVPVPELSSNIKYLWQWFENVNRFYEIAIPLNPPNTSIRLPPNSRSILIDRYPVRYCGLRALLNDFIQKRPNLPELQLNHDDRFKTIAYYLCGWEFKDGSISRQFFSNLENSNQFERACCLALLTQNFEQSLEILDTASKSDSRYSYLWIALKYFSDEQQRQKELSNNSRPTLVHQISMSSSTSQLSPLTKSTSSPSTQNSFNSNNNKSPYYSLNDSFELISKPSNIHHTAQNNSLASNTVNLETNELFLNECNKLIEYFNDSYLKALFNFLINKEDAIMKILRDKNILFQDRIALAVYFMYIPGKHLQLLEYFDTIIDDECVINADLHGVLLTGLGLKCIDLFQSFIDKTGDIQTICMAIIHTPYIDVLQKSKRVEYWINSYRDLLNKFKFWEKRAKFDVFKMKLLKSQNLVHSSGLHSSISMPPTILSNYTNSNASNISNNNSRSLTNALSSSLFLNNNPINNVHLICNQCGKNVLKNSSDISASSSLSASTFNIKGLNNAMSINKVANDSTLTGCLNCAKYFPQCTVCLQLIKVNLQPNLNSFSSVASTISSLLSNTSTSNNMLLQLNQYMPSPKINIYGNNKPNQLSQIQPFQFRSPNSSGHSDSNVTTSNKQNKLGITTNNNFKVLDLSNQKEINEIAWNRQIFSIENMTFLKTSKFGNIFSFCLKCKHGGHIKHLVEWFKSHQKCAFLHCKCECMDIDFNFIN